MYWDEKTRTIQLLKLFSVIMNFSLMVASLAALFSHDVAERLAYPAYGITDHSSMLKYITYRGFVTQPQCTAAMSDSTMLSENSGSLDILYLQQLDEVTMLEFSQPVIIQYSSNSVDSSYLSPKMCQTVILSPNENTVVETGLASKVESALWAYCKSRDVPAQLVDMAYTETTMVPLAYNNLLVLIFGTMSLTLAFSLSTVSRGTFLEKYTITPLVSLLWICISIVIFMVIPFTNKGLRMPVNNAMLMVVLHIAAAFIIVMEASWRKNRLNSALVGNVVESYTFNEPENILIKYAEYTLTAGLFLTSVSMTLGPTDDVYVYHGMYIGMMMCNLVAIPMHMNMVKKIKMLQKDYFSSQGNGIIVKWNFVIYIGLMMLVSWIYFFSSLISTLSPSGRLSVLINFSGGDSGIPLAVKFAVVQLYCFFLFFGLAGTWFYWVCVNLILKPDSGYSSQSKQDDGEKKEVITQRTKLLDKYSFQLVKVLELLNWCKWIISVCVLASVQSFKT